MSLAVRRPQLATSAHPLDPVIETVATAARGAELARLGADDVADWYPGSWLSDPGGPALTDLLAAVGRRWGLNSHAAAAIAFKGYAWAAVLPVVAGWLRHRRVPVLRSDRVRVGIAASLPYVRLDLADVPVAVLPDDPPAESPKALVVPDATGLLELARAAVLREHLADVATALHRRTRVGERLLWGSVAESLAYAVLALPVTSPGDPAAAVRDVLASFGPPVEGLVDVAPAASGPSIRRRTCCLWFTGSSGRGEYCSSCCVIAPVERT